MTLSHPKEKGAVPQDDGLLSQTCGVAASQLTGQQAPEASGKGAGVFAEAAREFLARYDRARRGRGGYPSSMERHYVRMALDQHKTMLDALRRIAAANPSNTNSATAASMASWTQAVAAGAISWVEEE